MEFAPLLVKLLTEWARGSESYWSSMPDGRGVYGTGFNSWGVQTQQKYITTLAVLACRKDLPTETTNWALDRALSALRFNLDSHCSGTGACTDGTQWGQTWLSPLGIERMMHGLHQLDPYFTAEDRASLKRILVSESEWLLTDYHRGEHRGLNTSLWDKEGGNDPESNIWIGCLLWRTAGLYPDHPHANQWKERAHQFLINGISVATDASSSAILGGKPVRDRYVGPNFFPNYGLDHHDYFNVGYMVICLSNLAMLHFDARLAGFTPPDSLYHHAEDLWKVVRRMIFGNGRLARLGGDTRIRYAYCQDYLLPALLLAADKFGDGHALALLDQQIDLIRVEADQSKDGAFYSSRLDWLKKKDLYYFTRLESDRASAIGMVLSYLPLVKMPAPASELFESSVQGGWSEPEHGSALHRSPTRLASFSWRAYDLMQGICQPPDDGHFAEWQRNLGGGIDFMHHPNYRSQGVGAPHRAIRGYEVHTFSGGFATWGSIGEGVDLTLQEGWNGQSQSIHQMVFVALPDDHTVVGLQYVRNGPHRSYTTRIQGMRFNLPNDFYNHNKRTITSSSGSQDLLSPAREAVEMQVGQWLNIEDRIGMIGVYGAESLTISRDSARRGGYLPSLFIEEICYPLVSETCQAEPDEILLDVGWIVVSSCDSARTEALARDSERAVVASEHSDIRIVRVTDLRGATYWISANFGSEVRNVPQFAETNLVTGSAVAPSDLHVPPGGCLIQCEG